MQEDIEYSTVLPAAEQERLLKCMSMIMHFDEVQEIVEVVEKLLAERLPDNISRGGE